MEYNWGRFEFLNRKNVNTENRYPGLVWSEKIDPNKEIVYSRFLSQFLPGVGIETESGDNIDQIRERNNARRVKMRKALYSNRKIIDIAREKNLIIDNTGFYVFFVDKMSIEDRTALQIHLTQNFIFNWEEYDKYISDMMPDSQMEGKLSVSTLTSSTILAEALEDRKERTYLDTDIQFVLFEDKDKDYYKGFYFDSSASYFSRRNDAGLITIVLFLGLRKDFKSKKYDGIRSTVKVRRNLILRDAILEDTKDNEPETKLSNTESSTDKPKKVNNTIKGKGEGFI
jgi:hypothetical protein